MFLKIIFSLKLILRTFLVIVNVSWCAENIYGLILNELCNVHHLIPALESILYLLVKKHKMQAADFGNIFDCCGDIVGDGCLFAGSDEGCVLTHNVMSLQKGDYALVGRCIGMALLYGGSGPHFFPSL